MIGRLRHGKTFLPSPETEKHRHWRNLVLFEYHCWIWESLKSPVWFGIDKNTLHNSFYQKMIVFKNILGYPIYSKVSSKSTFTSVARKSTCACRVIETQGTYIHFNSKMIKVLWFNLYLSGTFHQEWPQLFSRKNW